MLRVGNSSGLPDFRLLKDMEAEAASAFVVGTQHDQTGQDQTTAAASGWMAFKSGINKVFGFKSDSDKAANQNSLRLLKDYIGTQSSAYVAREVERSDVFQRAMQRGTYVSSSLTTRLKDIAVDAAKKELATGNREAATKFLERGRQVPVGPNHVAFQELPTNGLMDVIRDLRAGTYPGQSKAADQFSGAYAKMEEAFQKATAEGRADGKPRPLTVQGQRIDADANPIYDDHHPLMQGKTRIDDDIVRSVFAAVRRTAEEASARGERVTEEQLAKTAAEALQGKLGAFVVEANKSELKARVTQPEKLAEVVGHLQDAADHGAIPGVKKEDVQWLADVLAHDDEVEMPIPETRGRKKDGEWPYEVIRPAHLRHLIGQGFMDKLYVSQEDKDRLPLAEYNNRRLALVQREFTLDDFANALPKEVTEILKQRRAGMDAIQREQAQARQQMEQLAGKSVSVFPQLQRVPLPQSKAELHKVDSVTGFVKAVALDRIGEAEMASRRPQGSGALSQEEQLARNRAINASIENWGKRFDKELPALDRFATLKRQLDDINAKGGFISLDRTQWKNVQEEARSLVDAASNIRALAKDLAQYGDDAPPVLHQLSRALEAAARQIEDVAGSVAYLHDELSASMNQRMFGHLPQLAVVRDEQRRAEGDSALEGLDDEIAAIQRDLLALGGDEPPPGEPKAAAPRGRAAVGATPGETIRNTLAHALMTAEQSKKTPKGANEAFSKWVASAAPFLDKYAEFAVRHENDARLQRIPASERTPAENQRVQRFQKERLALEEEYRTFANETRTLTKVLGGETTPELAQVVKALDDTTEHVRVALQTGAFVRTARDNPFPTREDQLLHLNQQSIRNAIEVLSLPLGVSREELADDGVTILNSLRELDRFDQNLAALRRQNPVADRAGDRGALGAMDVLAERLEERATALERMIGRVDKMAEEVRAKGAGELFVPITSRYSRVSGEERTAEVTKGLDASGARLREQLKSLRGAVADYRLYRGDADPGARYAAATGAMRSALAEGRTPPGGWGLFVDRSFGRLIDPHMSTPAVRDMRDQMKRGLEALDNHDYVRRLVDPLLSRGTPLAEAELAAAKDGLAKLKHGHAELVRLHEQTKALEDALTGGKSFAEIPGAFHRIPGAQAWHELRLILGHAAEELEGTIKDYSRKIDAG